MLTNLLISYGVFLGVFIIMLTAHRENEDIWVRWICYIGLVLTACIGGWNTYKIVKLRNTAIEVPVHYEILKEGNRSYMDRTVVYIREKPDNTYSLYDKEEHLLADSIRSWEIKHIEIDQKDIFDVIEYVSFCGDTLLYDMYLKKPQKPEHFKPHYKEAIYWEFNYSNI